MPTAPVNLLDGSDVLDDNPSVLPAILPDPNTHDQDVHDIDIHAPSFHSTVSDSIPVLSIHDSSVYYSSFSDCSPFSHSLPPYSFPPQDAHLPHPDLHFVLPNDPNPPFAHNSPHVSPKQLHHSQDIALRGPSSLDDVRFSSAGSPHSLAYLPPLHDLPCTVDHETLPFAISSPPPKMQALAHTLLPPIVQANPADLARSDIENRSAIKRTVAGSASQVDPCAAPFLRDQLGEAKWNTFSARLFERRLGPTKSKVRVRGRNANDDSSSPPGATAIDFLVKVEVVKEVLRTYVPHPYNPLKSLTHSYPHSPSGFVTLTRSTILVLSGWSNTQFSYWARRAEGISVLAAHDDRLRSVAVALQKRINAGGVLLDGVDESEVYSQGSPNVTGKGLDIIIEQVKKRTGLSPFLRGKHSSLDPFGSTNSDKDAGPGPPQGVPAAPIYMPTFQAMEYSHAPAITTSAESPIARRPKKKRRISVADSVSSYASSTALKVDPSDEPTSCYSFLADNPRLTPDQESVSSSDMQPISPPSTITLPQLFDQPHMDENGLSPYELSCHLHGTEDGRPEYFPVSHSRSELDHSDSEHFVRKKYVGLTGRTLEKRPKLSA